MLKIILTENDFKAPNYPEKRDSIYHSIQEELCSVIERMGGMTHANDNEQLLKSLLKCQTDSPCSYVLKNDGSPISKHTLDIGLNSNIHQAFGFRISNLNNENKVIAQANSRASFQRKLGRWAFNGGMHPIFRFEDRIHDYGSTNITFAPNQPYYGVSLSITDTDKLRIQITQLLQNMRVLISHIRFVKRAL